MEEAVCWWVELVPATGFRYIQANGARWDLRSVPLIYDAVQSVRLRPSSFQDERRGCRNRRKFVSRWLRCERKPTSSTRHEGGNPFQQSFRVSRPRLSEGCSNTTHHSSTFRVGGHRPFLYYVIRAVILYSQI